MYVKLISLLDRWMLLSAPKYLNISSQVSMTLISSACLKFFLYMSVHIVSIGGQHLFFN